MFTWFHKWCVVCVCFLPVCPTQRFVLFRYTLLFLIKKHLCLFRRIVVFVRHKSKTGFTNQTVEQKKTPKQQNEIKSIPYTNHLQNKPHYITLFLTMHLNMSYICIFSKKKTRALKQARVFSGFLNYNVGIMCAYTTGVYFLVPF